MLWKYALRQSVRRPARTLLTLAGIVLGVNDCLQGKQCFARAVAELHRAKLRRRSGSLLAPAGLHWATNGLGVLVAAAVWAWVPR